MLCYTCKQDLPESCFNTYQLTHRKSKQCKVCRNREKVNLQTRKKLKAIAYKGGVCSRCGKTPKDENHHICQFDFHHRDPTTKNFEWTTMRNLRWAKIVGELDACDLVCANCHRLIEWEKSSLLS